MGAWYGETATDWEIDKLMLDLDSRKLVVREVEKTVDKHQQPLEQQLSDIESAVSKIRDKRDLSIGAWCGTCQFRENSSYGSHYWTCSNPMFRIPDYNPVTGETTYKGAKPRCSAAREEGSLCGPSGVLHEEQSAGKIVKDFASDPNFIMPLIFFLPIMTTILAVIFV